MIDLTQNLLHEIFAYDPETGALSHKERPRWMFKSGYNGGETSWRTWNTKHAGEPVSNCGSGGYLRVNINGRRYFAHRLIWLMTHGEWPEEVDHINGDRSDNRLCNLRAVDRQGNMRNTALRSNNTSGYIGVSYSKRDDVFIAYITVNKHTKVIGRYATAEQAAEARAKAQAEHGFHPNHGRAA